MGKNKGAKAVKADSGPKKADAVISGGVTKSSQTPVAKAKGLAKEVAVKTKSKKKVESSSESSDSDSDEEMSSASSASSDEESEVEVPKTKAKANGVAAAVEASSDEESESGDSSESSDSSDEEEAAPVAVKQVQQVTAGKVESESEDDDDSSDESSSDDEPAAKVKAPAVANGVNGKAAKAAKVESSDSESGSDDSSASESGSDSDSSDSDSESEEEPAPKKRKAEEAATPAAKKTKTAVGGDDEASSNLFVGQLSYNVDDEWLKREFEQYGEIESVTVKQDAQTGRSRGFGFVKFVSSADAAKAQSELNGYEIDGRNIRVDFNPANGARSNNNTPGDRARKFGDDRAISAPSATLFVANLSFDASADVLRETFSEHGEVIATRMPTDRETGDPKGFGYVEFNSIDDAKKAFEAMNGQPILGRSVRIDYSTPRPPREGGFGGSPGGFRGGRGGGRGDRGGRGGRGGGDRGRGGRGGGRGGFESKNRGGFNDFKGKRMSLD